MATPERNRCATCKHFELTPSGDFAGLCRRNSPHGGGSGWRGWPPVSDKDWCGQWAKDPRADQRELQY